MLRHRISRLAPHQNAKTSAILSAVITLIFVVPIFLIAVLMPGEQRFPVWAIFIAPIFYLVFTYIFTIIVCALYNVLVPLSGGFEYDATDPGAG